MKNKAPKFIIAGSFILLILNFASINYNNLDIGFYCRILASVILILAMLLELKRRRKNVNL